MYCIIIIIIMCIIQELGRDWAGIKNLREINRKGYKTNKPGHCTESGGCEEKQNKLYTVLNLLHTDPYRPKLHDLILS